jgi:hypothetical protein
MESIGGTAVLQENHFDVCRYKIRSEPEMAPSVVTYREERSTCLYVVLHKVFVGLAFLSKVKKPQIQNKYITNIMSQVLFPTIKQQLYSHYCMCTYVCIVYV